MYNEMYYYYYYYIILNNNVVIIQKVFVCMNCTLFFAIV